MSEQPDVEVNPGQAIYDALSEEAKAAVDSLSGDAFGKDSYLHDRFVATICRVHEFRPKSWALLIDGETQGRRFQNVTMNDKIVFGIDKDKVSIACQRLLLNEDIESPLRQVAGEMHAPYKDHEVALIKVPLAGLSDISDTIWKSHEQLLERFARLNFARSAFFYMHRDDARVKLAMLAKAAVPAPAYVPEDRYGLPMSLPGDSTVASEQDAGKRYWKISDSKGASEWDLIIKATVIAMDWHEAEVDLSDFPNDKNQFIARLNDETEISHPGAISLWDFRNEIKIGDEVLVYSAFEVLGRGQITGDYFYASDADKFRHRRPTRWDVTEPVPTDHVSGELQQKLSLQQTLTELTPEEFSVLTGRDVGEGERDGDAMSLDIDSVVQSSFASAGLTYTTLQIASFYTALQTKGFVILSGISGTGKSKLAQRFAEMLPSAQIIQQTVTGITASGINLQMEPYMQKYNRFIIPGKFHDELPLPPVGMSRNIGFVVNGELGEGRIETRQSGSSVVSAVFPRGAAAERFDELEVEQFLADFMLNDDNEIAQVLISTGIDGIAEKGSPKNMHTEAEGGLSQYTFMPFSPYMRSSHNFGRVYVPKRIARALPPMERGEDRIVSLSINSFRGTCRLNRTTHENPDTYIYLKDEAAAEFADLSGQGFYLRFDIDRNAGKVRSVSIVSKVPANEKADFQEDDWARSVRSNHLFLPVRPDWRDGKDLIGYHNPLSGKYVRTDFLDFIITASDDYRDGNSNAFFVILDEMNLAHIEYYFADVLSVIESDRDEAGWTIEGIPLAVGEEDADLPERIHLPPNLYIVGTVNMDETTRPFSPKVLDRAFTIELTEVDFDSYPPEPTDASELRDDEKQALLQAFTRNGRFPRIDKNDIRSVVDEHERFRDDLQRLNISLQRSRMHFGYRVFDEIMQFVFNAMKNGMFTPDEAFDHAVLMKVLPKFNGSRGKLHDALVELILWTRQEMIPTDDETRELTNKFEVCLQSGKGFDTLVLDSEDWRYPATGKRAALMMQDLYTDGFAAFG